MIAVVEDQTAIFHALVDGDANVNIQEHVSSCTIPIIPIYYTHYSYGKDKSSLKKYINMDQSLLL